MATKLVNLALYQTGWFCCVLGAAKGHPVVGALPAALLVLIHVALVKQRRREVGLLLAAGLIGVVVDSLQSCLGLLRFASGNVIGCIAPPWIAVMWMQFATLFRFSLHFLSGRYLLSMVFGAFGGPFAFWIGERLGAVTFGVPEWRSLLVLGSIWAMVLPVLLRLAGSERRPLLSPVYRGF